MTFTNSALFDPGWREKFGCADHHGRRPVPPPVSQCGYTQPACGAWRGIRRIDNFGVVGHSGSYRAAGVNGAVTGKAAENFAG